MLLQIITFYKYVITKVITNWFLVLVRNKFKVYKRISWPLFDFMYCRLKVKNEGNI